MIEPGQRLLHYRIVEKIGEGGMGAVWRAVDTHLGREVAIKVLPAVFSNDPERVARFDREARLLASLSHPSIAGVYAFHPSDSRERDVSFLAMEMVDGEDLAQRLARGPLAVDDVLDIGRQIAAALEAAHDKGVIHRDLKPANIKLTPEGKVKVLDFGLAKALEPGGVSGDAVGLSDSPTMTSAGTQAGTILGTAAYMSPEQARGKPLDRRTDLWSFGCVLYECLSGRQLFGGKTVSDSLAAVLRKDPDWSELPEATPPTVRLMLRRLLTREPGKRLRDAGDARLEFEEALSDPDIGAGLGGHTAAPARSVRVSAGRAAAIVVALAVGLLLGRFVGVSGNSRDDAQPLTRFTVAMPAGTILGSNIFGSPLALSPDGRTLVFQADRGLGTNFLGGIAVGGSQLYRRDLQSLEALPIEGTLGATTPFFSPQGDWLGFWAEGQLRKMPLSGGRPTTVLREVHSIAGAYWDRDDTIYFGAGLGGGISKVPAAGGPASVVTELDVAAGEIIHGDPFPLPGGALLFSSSGSGSRVFFASQPDRRRHLFDGGSARVLATGQLLFSERDALRVANFDASIGQLTGEALPFLDGVDYEALGGLQSASLAVSQQGTLAYALRRGDRVTALTRIGFDGTRQVLDIRPAGQHQHVRVSPDGERLVTSFTHDGIWVTDLSTGAAQPLWRQGAAYQARWSPDGRSVVFKLNGNLVRASATGGGDPEPVLDRDGYLTPFSWSADGQISMVEGLGHASDILILGPDGNVREFRATEATETNPEISPDGRMLAYVSDITGTPDVYIAPLPDGESQCAVTSGGGYSPAWSPDSQRLYYARDGGLWVADLSGTSCRTENHRAVLDDLEIALDFHQRSWDLLPDETGIVFVDSQGLITARAREIHVMLNGLREIERIAGNP